MPKKKKQKVVLHDLGYLHLLKRRKKRFRVFETMQMKNHSGLNIMSRMPYFQERTNEILRAKQELRTGNKIQTKEFSTQTSEREDPLGGSLTPKPDLFTFTDGDQNKLVSIDAVKDAIDEMSPFLTGGRTEASSPFSGNFVSTGTGTPPIIREQIREAQEEMQDVKRKIDLEQEQTRITRQSVDERMSRDQEHLIIESKFRPRTRVAYYK